MQNDHKYIVIFFFSFLIIFLPIGYVSQHYRQQSDPANVPQKTPKGDIVKIVTKKVDPRALRVYKFLKKYNSPLQDNATDFIEASDKYQIPYEILVAISGVESTFGKHTPSCAKYNVFGYSSSTSPCGWYRFTSYKEAIYKVAQTISRGRAYAKFQQTRQIYDLAKTYTAVPSEWAWKIEYFIELI